MRTKALDVDMDQQKHSIEILPAGYIGRDEITMYPRQSERLVSRIAMRTKALDVVMNHQRHSIETLPAAYIGRDENTMYIPTIKVND
jgi:hypothetical protein